MCAHEAENLCHAGLVDARGNIDKYQRGEYVSALVAFGLAFSEKRGDAAERRANCYRLCPRAASKLGGNEFHVRRKIRERVGAARNPVRVAMTSLIKRISHMPFARDRLRCFVPGVAGLTAAVQQQNGGASVAEHVGDKSVAGSTEEGRGGGDGVLGHDHSWRKLTSSSRPWTMIVHSGLVRRTKQASFQSDVCRLVSGGKAENHHPVAALFRLDADLLDNVTPGIELCANKVARFVSCAGTGGIEADLAQALHDFRLLEDRVHFAIHPL